MPGATNLGGGEGEPLVPRDEISAIAGRILGKHGLSDELAKTNVAAANYNELLADAKKLAGFVLNADPKAGANRD